MFHPWRVLSFAALAAMVSFNLRAEVVEIGSAEELAAAIATNPSGDYKLTADIDCSGWTTCDFSGTLDGNGKSIKGLTVPLFGTVLGSAQIKNLVVSQATVIQDQTAVTDNVGILANNVNGTDVLVSGVTFTGCTLGKAGAKGTAGMIAGRFTVSGTVENVLVDESCKVRALAACWGVAGLVGEAIADGQGSTITFSNCITRQASAIESYTTYSAGLVCRVTVKGSGKNVADMAFVKFIDCTNHVGITANMTNPTFGGFVVSADAASNGANLGGIEFTRCVNYGSVNLNTYSANLGGFVCTGSYAALTFTDCINYGDMTSTTEKPTGGFIGKLGFIGSNMAVSFVGCANLGNITGNAASGFIGEITYNQYHYTTGWSFDSCLQKGRIAPTSEGGTVGEFIGNVATGWLQYPKFEVKGCLARGANLIGKMADGVTVKELIIEDNIDASVSEGLYNGVDVAALNAVDSCNLWKQGSTEPILKCMPDEPAPDLVTVTFKDAADFGSPTLKESLIIRNTAATAPDVPLHDGYRFLNWDNPFDGVAEDLTVTAVYELTGNTHEIQYFDGETFLGREKVEDGQTAKGPESIPEYEGHSFVCWLLNDEPYDLSVPPTEDLVLYTHYEINHYDVRFFSEGDQIGETQSVVYQESAVAPADPVSKNPDLVFAHWDADFSCITEPLDVTAVYVPREMTVTSANFAEVVNASVPPQTTCILAEDITLENWSPVDFCATLDGAGHTIRGLTGNLFDKLTGGVRNFVLDGGEEGTKISLAWNAPPDFGLVAVSCVGGAVEGITVRNYSVVRANGGASGCNLGILVGRILSNEGAPGIIRDCTVEQSCSICHGTNGNRVGGIVGGATVSDLATDQLVALVEECTNAASVSAAVGVDGGMGGIMGMAIGFAKPGPRVVLRNCVNLGDVQGDDSASVTNDGQTMSALGGILGKVNGDTGSDYKGDVLISGCRNSGSVGAHFIGSQVQCGGMVGGAYRQPMVTVTNCANFGAIGNSEAANSGAIFGSFPDGVAYSCLAVLDSANYGDVCGISAGAVIGGYAQNNNARGLFLKTVNWGNYGVLSGLTIGAFVANFTTDLGTGISGSFSLISTNCFAIAEIPAFGICRTSFDFERFYVETNGLYSASTKDFSASRTVKALNSWSEKSGFCSWTQGKVGDKVYPELGIFCEKPYVNGFMLFIR